MQENLRTEAGLSYRHLFPPSQICSTIINGAKAALRENVHGKPALPGLIIRGTGVTRATTTHACRLPDYLDVAARDAAHSYERASAQFSFFEENVAQPPRRLGVGMGRLLWVLCGGLATCGETVPPMFGSEVTRRMFVQVVDPKPLDHFQFRNEHGCVYYRMPGRSRKAHRASGKIHGTSTQE
ncbi:hypothetical protein ZHAS_00006827 [Anopheles sinensis]|uniref:Uncharacterized protein n=1 Tax=Anopheles sinensis TaxID=74873 RepID=A0A084VN55_ANOSI|nr:hypothetical protein ZHAS_00006827 [Anopheles sinensis]